MLREQTGRRAGRFLSFWVPFSTSSRGSKVARENRPKALRRAFVERCPGPQKVPPQTVCLAVFGDAPGARSSTARVSCESVALAPEPRPRPRPMGPTPALCWVRAGGAACPPVTATAPSPSAGSAAAPTARERGAAGAAPTPSPPPRRGIHLPGAPPPQRPPHPRRSPAPRCDEAASEQPLRRQWRAREAAHG